jgi:hypothetical protein
MGKVGHEVFRAAVANPERRQRPSTEGMDHPLVALMKRCWAHLPGDRPTFDQIVEELEKNPFKDTDRERFEKYLEEVQWTRKKLDVEIPNDDVLLLLKRATNVKVFKKYLDGVDCAAPWGERLAVAFGVLTMQGDLINEFVVNAVRYMFATKGSMDKALFEKLNGPRKKFALGRYLVDPNQTFPAGFIVGRVPLDGKKNTLAREIKNVLSLICCQHKCVARFVGWNLIHEGDHGTFVTVSKPGEPITVRDIPDRDKFVIGVASGMAKLHSLGICHDGFPLDSVGIDEFSLGRVGIGEDGWPLIGGFGLIPAGVEKRFTRDARACGTLFRQPGWGDWVGRCRFLAKEEQTSSFDEFLHQVKNNGVPDGTVNESTVEFPFELLMALTDAKKWEASDGDVEDVLVEIARLTGATDDDIAEVTATLRRSINESHIIDPKLIPDF